jgi:ABC-type hemin transport system substrate-binding protein
VASISGSNFSGWFNASAGTLFASALYADLTNGRLAATLQGSTSADRITIGAGSAAFGGAVVDTSSVQANMSSGSKVSIAKHALAYSLNDFAFCSNSETVATDTSGTVPSLTQLGIGARPDLNAATILNGHVKRLAFWGQRLPNNVLQQLTQ